MPARPPRDHALDMLKGIAILAVVLVHIPPSRFDARACPLLETVQACMRWCVLAFFFAAGRLCPVVDRLGGDLVRFLLTRTRRLLIPCMAFSLLYRITIAFLSSRGLVTTDPIPFPSDLAGWALWIFTPAPPHLYFLPYLLLIQIVAMVTRSAAGPRTLLIVCFALPLVVALGGFSGFTQFPLHGGRVDLFPLYLAMFGHGYASQTFPALSRWPGVLAVCLLTAASAAWQHSPHLLAIAAPCVLYLGFQQLPLKANPLTRLGQQSGSVYVWHTPILLPATSLLWTHLLGSNYFSLILAVATAIALALLAGLGVRRIPALWPFKL